MDSVIITIEATNTLKQPANNKWIYAIIFFIEIKM